MAYFTRKSTRVETKKLAQIEFTSSKSAEERIAGKFDLYGGEILSKAYPTCTSIFDISG
jgi:hypothetical protein